MNINIKRIATKARNSSKESFNSLAHHITPDLMWESLKKIPKQTAVGVDKQDVQETMSKFPKWSKEVISKVHTKGYKPPPTRKVLIPKLGKSEKRPIAIPTIIDRVLQKSVVEVLNAIYEQDFLNSSFGGRPGKSAHQALATLNKAITGKRVNWVYEADLKNFFGSLNHQWIERFVKERVKDPRILTLIKKWLKAGVMEGNEHHHTREGAPQGGPISVLLSNIYLHYVLDLWIEKVVKPRMRGQVYYVRYLDDFVVCFQYHTDAIRFQRVIGKRLGKFSLSLAHEKTRLIEFGKYAKENTKRKGTRTKTLYFLGFQLYCSKTQSGSFKLVAKTEKHRLRRAHTKIKDLLKRIRHFALKEQGKAIDRILRGLYQYYGIWGNIDSLYQIYRFTLGYWRKSLGSRSQRGRMNWERYDKILKLYPLRKPRLSIPYGKIDQYSLL